MTALARPDLRLHASWAATLDEMGEEFPHGSGVWHLPDEVRADRSAQACATWVEQLLRCADPATDLAEDLVHCDYYWITDADPGDDPVSGEMVGFLALRHSLTPYLLEEGGHIGYSVRPSRRREGHATRALGLAVHRAAELGIERVLVTCDEDNEASARTIEAGGGELEDVRKGKRRYWIRTPSA